MMIANSISYADSPSELTGLVFRDCFTDPTRSERALRLATIEGRRVLPLIPFVVGEYLCKDYFDPNSYDEFDYDHSDAQFSEVFSRFENFEFFRANNTFAEDVLGNIPVFLSDHYDDLMDAAGMFLVETLSNKEQAEWFVSLSEKHEISFTGLFNYLIYAIHFLGFYSFSGEKDQYDKIASFLVSDLQENLPPV